MTNVWNDGLLVASVLAGALVFGALVHNGLFFLAKRHAQITGKVLHNALVVRCKNPARLLLPLLAVSVALPELPIPMDILDDIQHVVGAGLIASVAWLSVAVIHVFEDSIAARYRIDTQDNLLARRVQTQIRMLRRIAVGTVVFVAIALILMTFPSIRHLGVSLLASAGLAGIVVGMAARPALSNLLAGLQIAMTQPIRIEDVVIVEGEWGWIEEITTTYVVVRIWDLRRLVVPLSYFIERPFQNWTRITADLLGTVFLYADYTVPVEAVRKELHRILASSGMWDGKVWGLQVTNATEHVLELRALMSAPDSGTAWNLRCHVREQLVAYLQAQFPQSLPQTRARLERDTISNNG